jgi:hypothetical protein
MLSKSQFVRGLQCHKALWLLKHRPELRQQPDALNESLFETGHTVGALACQLFPGGVEIEFDSNDFDGMVRKTQELIESGAEVIYEATFKEKGIFAMADILIKQDQGWAIYEVKASTGVKPYHQNDAAIQWYALSSVLSLTQACIVHVNNEYTRQGELDVNRLFTIEDITDIVLAKQHQIPSTLGSMEAMLKGSKPSIDIGPQCNDPHECDFSQHCWSHIPERSVFNLYRMPGKKKFELYREGKTDLSDLALEDHLSEVQSVQVATSLSDQVMIDKETIQSFLDTLEYPINYLDFETFQEAIPRFDGQKPYMQMPFQYSLHIQHEDGTLEHKEFLGDEHSDPRESLIIQMSSDLTPTGSIMAYNMAFEKRMIRELANDFPEHAAMLTSLLNRFVDLLDPFRRLGYYHPDFNGSFSIKSVLPALFPSDPELDYKALNIQNGGMAMDTFANLHKLKELEKRDNIRRELLAYCHLDTLAMVKIHSKLTKIIQPDYVQSSASLVT